MPSIKVKKGGVYTDPVGIFAKKAGVYSAVQGVFAKSAGVYGQVDSFAGQVLALYAAGELGSWITPYDLPDLAQDSAGSVPFTAVEQRAGRVADKSPRGNYARQTTPANRPTVTSRWNLLTNARWSGGPPPTTWTNAVGTGTSVPNGSVGGNTVYRQTAVAQRPMLAAAPNLVYLENGATAGVLGTYRFPTVYSGSAQIQNLHSHNVAGAVLTYTLNGVPVAGSAVPVAGDVLGVLVKTGGVASTPQYRIGAGTSGAATIDFDMYAPQLDFEGGASPGRPMKFQFDGGSDALVTTYPGALGSNCTVGIAIPGVGASIATGQTIGTTYTDSVTHSGRVIVNRALTGPETASLTAYLNQLAGVSPAFSGFSAMKRAIRANAADVNMLVIGDSTGNDGDEWVANMGRWMASEYPTHNVVYHLWNDTLNAYSAPFSYSTTGSGPNTIHIWNASVAGSSADYLMGAKYAAAITSIPSLDAMAGNYGHNMLGQDASSFLGPIDQVRASFPSTPQVWTIQNPRRDDELYTPMAATIASLPSLRNFLTTVNAGQPFFDRNKNPDMYADFLHPNALGERYWTAAVTVAIRTAIAN